jgi:hypothetical protein
LNSNTGARKYLHAKQIERGASIEFLREEIERNGMLSDQFD